MLSQKGAWELIIVDDGSNDGSGELCDNYAKLDSRLRVIHTENEGLSSARNTGLKYASGEYIRFMDSDDILMPGSVNIAYGAMEDNDLFIFGYESFPARILHQVESVFEYDSLNSFSAIYPFLANNMLFNTVWNKQYRKSIIDKNNISFIDGLSPGEDTMFNCAYLKCSQNYKLIPDILYKFRRINSSSLSSKYNEDLPMILQMLKKTTDDLFCHDPEIEYCTTLHTVNYMLWHIKACAYCEWLSKSEKILQIEKCLNDSYFCDLSGKTEIQVNKLYLFLFKRKNAKMIYNYYHLKKYYDKIILRIKEFTIE